MNTGDTSAEYKEVNHLNNICIRRDAVMDTAVLLLVVYGSSLYGSLEIPLCLDGSNGDHLRLALVEQVSSLLTRFLIWVSNRYNPLFGQLRERFPPDIR
jgi:hypothetical protein